MNEVMRPVKISGVNTQAAIPSDIWVKNIKDNIKRDLPRFHHLKEFMQPKGDKRIALVGGGPSLREHLDVLRTFDTIMVVGSAHDYIREHGIIPTYSIVCDPDKISSYYLNKSAIETTYLVATNCDESVFKVLEGKKIYQWHCYSDDDYTKEIIKLEPDYHAVAGGCTVGLRALSMALMLGYGNLHFFGYDSCVSEKEEAYAYATDPRDNMIDLMGTIYNIQLGKDEPTSKVYKCLGYQLAQVQHFLDFFRKYHKYFICTFYGDGLLKAAYEVETGVT